MFKNYLKTAWRNLTKSKAFSLINILGLTIGISVCLLIFIFLRNEYSVDTFHADRNRIYRVMRGFDNEHAASPWVSGPYATALENDFPGQIEEALRVRISNNLFAAGQRAFNEKKVYQTDASFFSFFSFPLLQGNPETVLKDPASVVLTRKTAVKYFGSPNAAMGQVLEMDKEKQLKVTGIAADVPANSTLDFDMIVPLSNYYSAPWFNSWLSNNQFTYLRLARGVDAAQLEAQFQPFMDKYMHREMEESGIQFSLQLAALPGIYFTPASPFDPIRHGDRKVVFIFLSIAILILLIACMNFMNLSTIRAVDRSREVGMRKVMGASKKQLIGQFIGESVLLTLASCVLSLGVLQLTMPFYNQLVGYEVTIPWNSGAIYLFLLAIIMVAGLLAGSYPAFVLSAFTPIESLKGKLKLGKGGNRFRQALVVVQFSISVILVIGTVVIMQQMRYVKNRQLGYDKEQTLVIPIDNGEIDQQLDQFKRRLTDLPQVQQVSMMSGEPGGFFDQYAFEVEGRSSIWKARTEFSDFEIVQTLGLTVIAGRNFSAQFPTDSTDAVLINRTAAANLGFSPDEAIGKWIRNTFRDDTRRRIVGVVEDFNFLSLRESMDPLVITPGSDKRVTLVRLQPGQLATALPDIKALYSEVAPVFPFEYQFLDEVFNELYKNDVRQQTLLTVFAGLAIFIACLGLFGLASFTATKRVKEIGVRKVLGSSVGNIVLLLSRDLLKPVLIATCIAIPVGYWAMSRWLQNFAFKTSLNVAVFLMAAGIILGIAVCTVSIRAIRAALANPVKSIRTE